MKAGNFEEANVVFTGDDCDPLHARRYRGDMYRRPVAEDVDGYWITESRWIPSDAERKAIAEGGAIVLKLIAPNPQPSWIGVVIDGKEVEG